MTTKPEKPKRIPPPRIVFYPTPELIEALNELHEVTGASRSGFVTELMCNALPMIQQLVKAARLAKAKDIAALDVMNAALQAALCDGQQMSLEIAKNAGQIRSNIARVGADAETKQK